MVPRYQYNSKKRLQVAQNKIIRFLLNLDNRSHVGHNEFNKTGLLDVTNRVSQLKLGHAFKINHNTCPNYLGFHFRKLNEYEGRIDTRGKAYNFHVPKISPNTFAFSTIKDWNSLPNDIKSSSYFKSFKEKVVKHLAKVTKLAHR